ncbi:MAG: GNAT family N-acetyltransferase [Ignavibacteria bacterium]|nr:GNAT family N-acetyltransferase [Ignavibacteria bacterium]
MKIIKASQNELEKVACLFNDYRIFYDQETDIEGATSYIKERMENNESIIYLALDDDGNAMGFVQLYPSFTSIGMKRMWILNDLYVDIIHRKKNAAEMLINRCKELIHKTGAAGLVLETQNDNFPAQKLYFKTGFIKDELHCNFFWKAN